MELITRTELPAGQCEIKHSDRLLLMGSCFTDNIGNRLSDSKFRCDVNPFGVLYNPMSIFQALNELVDRKVYSDDDVMESRGVWFSLMHHSSFLHLPKNCVWRTLIHASGIVQTFLLKLIGSFSLRDSPCLSVE